MCWPICAHCKERLSRVGWCLRCEKRDQRFIDDPRFGREDPPAPPVKEEA